MHQIPHGFQGESEKDRYGELTEERAIRCDLKRASSHLSIIVR